MDNNKIIIILLIIIIAILAIGISFMVFQNFGKEECKLKIVCNDSMQDGDTLKIQLTDLNKSAIANETLNVQLIKGNETKEFNITTNKNGIATLKLNNLSEGKYVINASFNGNDKYLPVNDDDEFNFIELKIASSSNSNSIDANRPTNDENYKGYNPYHESETTADGWNPNEHEVSREDMGDGNQKIHYDDGYFRLVDENGYVITYGYG